ncbi:MAG: carbon starvation protein A, partial [Methylocystis sp.]|nr:carbon starvation protein A [Methylocystis sp.]
IDAGTRVARFMIQDLLGTFAPALRRTQSWTGNLLATALAVTGWGYFLYQGVIDPLGGINTLWPLFGIANQMLAAIALTLCTVVLFRMKREAFALVTLAPTVWLAICTLTAGGEKLFHDNPKIGFLAHAARFQEATGKGQILAPAKTMGEMQRVVFNDYVDAALSAVFIVLVVSMLIYGAMAIRAALRAETVTTKEVGDELHDLRVARA